jgi:hypothetical protein
MTDYNFLIMIMPRMTNKYQSHIFTISAETETEARTEALSQVMQRAKRERGKNFDLFLLNRVEKTFHADMNGIINMEK